MKGYSVQFNIYAESQEEADRASTAIKQFISEKAASGIAVTANKVSEAIGRFKDNYFVTQFFK